MFDTNQANSNVNINSVPYKDKFPFLKIDVDTITLENAQIKYCWLPNHRIISINNTVKFVIHNDIAGYMSPDKTYNIYYDPDSDRHNHRYIEIKMIEEVAS